jgi:hypothetical protein
MEATDRPSDRASSESTAIVQGLGDLASPRDAFSTLPPELLLAIIEYVDDETKEGFYALKALSCTNKVLRQRCILWTRLFRHLYLFKSNDAVLCQAFTSQEIRPNVKALTITEMIIRETPEQLAMLLNNLPGIKKLRINGNLFDCRDLRQLPRLDQSLHSFSTALRQTLISESCLPELEEFTFGNIIATRFYADLIAAVGMGRLYGTSSSSDMGELGQQESKLKYVTLHHTIMPGVPTSQDEAFDLPEDVEGFFRMLPSNLFSSVQYLSLDLRCSREDMIIFQLFRSSTKVRYNAHYDGRNYFPNLQTLHIRDGPNRRPGGFVFPLRRIPNVVLNLDQLDTWHRNVVNAWGTVADL